LHYRDSKGLEVDAIVELFDGRWGGIEVKLGSTAAVLDSAANTLLRMRDRVGSNRCAFLAVVTNGPSAYRRADGVNIVPVRMLGP
jgi:hypothetical protein